MAVSRYFFHEPLQAHPSSGEFPVHKESTGLQQLPIHTGHSVRREAKVPTAHDGYCFGIVQWFRGDMKLTTPFIEVDRNPLKTRPYNLILSEPICIGHPSTSSVLPFLGSLSGISCVMDSGDSELIDWVFPDMDTLCRGL